ncbi:male-specific lethal 1 homolog isoform X2 [Acanthaster planci]|uniref:Male-specific lethal 1 homolog isoform X2 n=1 Tax=Acanthaster planci TaxID=133434 RepID=A0A8B7YZY1_ACAPL|nr:male-specific lethal 1 homolog isoform X2 [Acanthaster planci]
MSILSILRGIFPFLLNPMAPGNMKSDIVGLQRNKIVSKGALSRKALARIGQNEELSSAPGVINNMAMLTTGMHTTTTGDSNPRAPSLAAALGDGTKNSGPGGGVEETDEEPLMLLDEGKVLETHEVQHLKALSMLHLDVIEQQQQELQRREKELQKVRAQNDTARLERIQRRTVLAQKHREPLPNHIHIPAPVSSDSSCTNKRKSSTEPTTPIKRQQTERDATPSKSPTLSPAGTPTSARRRQIKLQAKERVRARDPRLLSSASRTKEERPPKREERTLRKDSQGSKAKEDKRNGGEPERGGVKGEQYLKTEVIYPCLSDLRVMDPDPALPEGQTEVQVPSWRINILSSSNCAEIVEDLEETTFERRHQKYEVAEQKRKRWDIQRVRELREHERLEQKMLRREYGNWDDVLKTFYPEPSDACQLQVSDTIPLVAFGVQVPVAKDGEFELPWFDVNKREKEETMRQTRSRTNRR